MKFLIVGLGSMGKRRIRNLQHLEVKDIIAFDLNGERRVMAEEKYNIVTFDDIGEAIRQKPDCMIISTPPNHHYEYELLAIENKIHFFCEAGIFTENEKEIIDLCRENEVVGIPSCTLRFNLSIRKMKELIDANRIGKPVAFSYHMGQYLPDWHPWEDISKFYVGQRDTSATREMVPFELEWLSWFFGSVDVVSCFRDKTSSLKVDIDDVYQLILRFNSGLLGNMLVDVVARDAIRFLRIVGEEGTIEWDWMKDEVRLFEATTKKWVNFKEEESIRETGYLAKEQMYIDELKNFIDKVQGIKEFPYSLEENLQILTVLNLAEESSKSGKHMKVAH